MKKIILIIDEDIDYSKKFCNQANKLFGKKYVFLTFSNVKSIVDYTKNENVESVIVSESYLDYLDDLCAHSFYVLNEKEKKVYSEGKKNYIYKLQNIKNILEIIDNDIEKRYEKNSRSVYDNKKLVLFYTNETIKEKNEIVKKIAKHLSKKYKVLVVDLDEFDNYKANVGLSNIIFDYKESKLTTDKLEREVVEEKGINYIKSVTYPDDFNVITNIDLANIINEIMNMPYDYIFVNADASFVKCEYVMNDADKVILFKSSGATGIEKFKSYLKNENLLDLKKISELNVSKIDRISFTNFVKTTFGGENDR